jgi:hypothetical protein
MNVAIRAAMCLVVSTVFSIEARAEKWVGTEIPSPSGGGIDVFYVDTDSVVRNGDIASIKVRFQGFERQYLERRWSYDCVRKLDDEGRAVKSTGGRSTFAFEKACKRFWEFWK